ncbi:hypothetical protein [Runella sp. SP2]|uniref:hypothetical protein n=1 Tax=Runella sp. SP2 TaxID=2268026 RepID=UPI000F098473|nr:hypothetical protein [Runella sp. SP2]AYQ36574.1 hypothetical protein DTQ70_30090 [Runella sp. SP2]
MEKVLILWCLLALGGCESPKKNTPTVDIQQLTQSEWVLQKEIILSDVCTSQPITEETDTTNKAPTYYRLYDNGRFEIGNIDTIAVEHPPPMTIICKGWWDTKGSELMLQFTEGDVVTATITHLCRDTLQLDRGLVTEKEEQKIYRQFFLKQKKGELKSMN